MATVLQAVDLTVVHVNVGLGKAGPWAKPESATVWTRPDAPDLIHLQGSEAFTIEFKADSPFPQKKYEAWPKNGQFVVEERIRRSTGYGTYRYDLTFREGKPDEVTLDPDLVVKKDPR